MGIAKNRKVSIDGREYVQVQKLQIPDQRLVVHLKQFGRVKVFQKTFKNEGESTTLCIYLTWMSSFLHSRTSNDCIQFIEGLSATTGLLSKSVALKDLW